MATKTKTPSPKKTPAKTPGTRGESVPKTKTPKTPSTPKTAKDGVPKGPGVIASIQELLTLASAKEPLSKDALLAKLVKRFPSREADAMKKTINCQVPGRLSKEKKVKVQSNDDGFWIV